LPDEITYVYACIKRGIGIKNNELILLINKYKYDERIGLVIWAAGKLRYWDIVQYISENYQSWRMHCALIINLTTQGLTKRCCEIEPAVMI
jgi:hypothetical protein